MDALAAVVAAVSIPVQAVGGLSIQEAIRAPQLGAPLVVIGAPLTIDAEAFRAAKGDVEQALAVICRRCARVDYKRVKRRSARSGTGSCASTRAMGAP